MNDLIPTIELIFLGVQVIFIRCHQGFTVLMAACLVVYWVPIISSKQLVISHIISFSTLIFLVTEVFTFPISSWVLNSLIQEDEPWKTIGRSTRLQIKQHLRKHLIKVNITLVNIQCKHNNFKCPVFKFLSGKDFFQTT